MSDKPKTPGHVCYEVCPDGACPFESLMPSEREMWERRAAAVVLNFTDPQPRSIGIGDPPPPPPPPPGVKCDEQGIGIPYPPPPPPPPG
jgi:hypothetical protein